MNNERTFTNHVRVGDEVEEFAKNLYSFVLTFSLHLNTSTEGFRDVLLKELGVKCVNNL